MPWVDTSYLDSSMEGKYRMVGEERKRGERREGNAKGRNLIGVWEREEEDK